MDRTFGDISGVFFEILELSAGLLFFLLITLFFWGLVKFLNSGGDETSIKNGKSLMLWGVIGIFAYVSLWAIVSLFSVSIFGADLFGLPQLPTS